MAERVLPSRERATLDALGDQERSTTTIAFDMGVSYNAAHSRLMALWKRGVVDREWRGAHMRWRKVSDG